MTRERERGRSRGASAVGLLFLVAVLCSAVLIGGGCSGKQITRLEEDATVDLSGRWNDTDSRLVAEEMIVDCLDHPWIAQHMQRDPGDLPVVIAGAVRNLGTEHIAVGTFVADIERGADQLRSRAARGQSGGTRRRAARAGRSVGQCQ